MTRTGALEARRLAARVLLPLVALLVVAVSVAPRAGHAAQADVLILRSSVGVPNALNGASFPPEASPEVMAVTSMGMTYDLVTEAQWAAMTQAQFAAYKAIVIGDAGCAPAFSDAPFGANGSAPDPNFPFYNGYLGTTVLTSTTNTWGPVTTGNSIVIGTDPATHVYQPNGPNMNIYDGATAASMWRTSGGKMIYGGIRFAADQAGYGTGTHTGLYAALGCRYEGFPDTLLGTTPALDPGWPLYQSTVIANSNAQRYPQVPWLAGIHDGTSITVDGTAGWAQGGYNAAELVADHPAFNSLQPDSPMSDDDVSGWSTSVHAAIRSWAPYDPVNDPRGWIVLAMATDFGTEYTANNGHRGTPYIIVRGNGLQPRTDLSIPGACTGSSCFAPHATTGTPYTITVQDRAVCPAGSAPGSIPQYVTFTITGPNGPLTSPPVLVVNGYANWAYQGVNPGTDTIVASNIDCVGNVQRSAPATVSWTVPGTHQAQLVTVDQVTGRALVAATQDYSDRKLLKTRLFDNQSCTAADWLTCAPIAGQPILMRWDGSVINDVTCLQADMLTPAVPATLPCTTDAGGWIYYSVNHTPGPSDFLTGARDHRLDLAFMGTSNMLPTRQSMPYTVTLDPTSTAITSMPTAPLQGNNTWAVSARTVDDCTTFDDPVACASGIHRPVVGRALIFTITGGNLTSPYQTRGTTDATGSTTVWVPLPAGVYQVTAAFNGDNFYRPSQAAAPTTIIAYRPTCFSIWGGDTDRTQLDSLTGIAAQSTLPDSQATAATKAWYQFWGNKWVQGGSNKDGLTHPGVVGSPQTFATTSSTYNAHMDFKGCVWSTGHQGGDGRIAWGLAGFPAWTTDPGTSSFPPPSVDAYIGVIVTCTTVKSNHDDIGDVCGLVVLHVEDYQALGSGRLAVSGSSVDISGGAIHADSGHPGFGQVVAVIASR